MAQSTATGSDFSAHSEEPLLIPAIVKATGLPAEYLAEYFQARPIGNTRCAGIRKSKRFWSLEGTEEQRNTALIDIPNCIIKELQTMPYTHLLGQGVLIRNIANKHTSFITIAEAAFAQLNGLVDLLECLLIAISQAVNELVYVEWNLSWTVDEPWRGSEDNLLSQERGIVLNNARGKREGVREVESLYGESDSHHTQVLPSNPPSPLELQTISTNTNLSSRPTGIISPAGQKPFTGAPNKQNSDLRPKGRKKSNVQRRSLEPYWNDAERRWEYKEALVDSRGGLRQNRATMEIYGDTTIVADEPMEAEIDLALVPAKQDSVCWSPLVVSYRNNHWAMVTTSAPTESTIFADFETVLRWLEIILGQRSDEDLLHNITWLTVLERRDWSLGLIDLKDEVLNFNDSCWRRKILQGRVLRVQKPIRRLIHMTATDNRWFSENEAGLRLTAACLWSLFDNSLREVPCCSCTFISEGGDYLQCRQKKGQWLVWHILDAKEKICDGQNCHVSISFAPGKKGEPLTMTTPCVLDWTAETRNHAGRPIAKCVEISTAMTKRKVVKRHVDSLQAQVSLSAMLPVAPQILGGVTFSKKRYKIANSIDHDSEIAMNIAVAAIVLVYCEKSGVHLNMNGAELLETVCVSLLQQMDCRDVPGFFESGTAETRLQSWRNSTFLTSHLSLVPGSDLVRQASKLVTSLLQSTKNISKSTNGKPVYWTLESLLRQSEEEALLPPKHNTHLSWHVLASKAPPLILAVGEIDPRLVTGSDKHLSWLGYGASRKSVGKDFDFDWFGKSANSRGRGGLVTNRLLYERWVRYATTSSFRGQLAVTTDSVLHTYKNNIPGIESTFRIIVVEDNRATHPEENLSLGCTACSQTSDQQCLHYIQ
ncbi:hypothetical protein MMC15_003779 [Xylographa vitiligo]|nr:hypothetical protein [Xylographa vitiligo]